MVGGIRAAVALRVLSCGDSPRGDMTPSHPSPRIQHPPGTRVPLEDMAAFKGQEDIMGKHSSGDSRTPPRKGWGSLYHLH